MSTFQWARKDAKLVNNNNNENTWVVGKKLSSNVHPIEHDDDKNGEM